MFNIKKSRPYIWHSQLYFPWYRQWLDSWTESLNRKEGFLSLWGYLLREHIISLGTAKVGLESQFLRSWLLLGVNTGISSLNRKNRQYAQSPSKKGIWSTVHLSCPTPNIRYTCTYSRYLQHFDLNMLKPQKIYHNNTQ